MQSGRSRREQCASTDETSSRARVQAGGRESIGRNRGGRKEEEGGKESGRKALARALARLFVSVIAREGAPSPLQGWKFLSLLSTPLALSSPAPFSAARRRYPAFSSPLRLFYIRRCLLNFSNITEKEGERVPLVSLLSFLRARSGFKLLFPVLLFRGNLFSLARDFILASRARARQLLLRMKMLIDVFSIEQNFFARDEWKVKKVLWHDWIHFRYYYVFLC